MRPGRMDQRIAIEELTETQDAQGEPVAVWTEWASVWAEVRDLRGREYFQAQAVQSAIDTIFFIRHIENLTHKMRIWHGGSAYDIKGIARIGRNDGMEIQAVRAAA